MTPRSFRWLTRGLAAAALGATVAQAVPSEAAPWSNRFSFASPRFEQVWRETDANPGGRSLTWGPRPWFDYREFYKQSPNSLRQVQYFDKARMEINDPRNTTRAGLTNGLLPVEMVSGRVKLGDGSGADQYDQRTSAVIPVAGDLLKVNPDAPTYASFVRIATVDNGYTDRNRLNERIGTTFDKAGNIGFSQALANQAGTEIVQYATATGHNVPRVFVDFQTSSPIDALSTFGFPITDPYWIKAKVGGVDKDIMVQIFERRVLTYTPSNNDPFKVEMGNVGQHYFQWRYPDLGAPWENKEPYIPVAFASNRATPGHLEVFTTDPAGTAPGQITAGGSESVAFSMKRSWDQDKMRIIGDSKRENGKRQLFSYTLNGSVQTRLHTSDANDYNGSISPDGTKIAFVSDRDGNPEIFLLNMTGGGLAQLTKTAAPCINEYPTWYPDGGALVYHSNCVDNNFEVYTADLQYAQDKAADLQATLTGVLNLTGNPGEDVYPRVSPSGDHIAFRSNRDGNGEIYVMRSRNGTALRRFTNSSRGDDSAPTWSPDGAQIVYDSNVEGDYELYSRNFSDGGGQRQLTDNGADDRFAIFAQ